MAGALGKIEGIVGHMGGEEGGKMASFVGKVGDDGAKGEIRSTSRIIGMEMAGGNPDTNDNKDKSQPTPTTQEQPQQVAPPEQTAQPDNQTQQDNSGGDQEDDCCDWICS